MWSGMGLFASKPPNVIDDAMDTMKSLNALRTQKIANALNQIKLQHAPVMAQQAQDLGAANVSVKQNEAKYAPQMSLADLAQKHAETIYRQLQSKGAFYDNLTKKAESEGAPAKVQAALAYQKALTKEALSHAQQYLGKANAPAKGTLPDLDADTGEPISSPSQPVGDQGMGAPQGMPQAPGDASTASIGAPAATTNTSTQNDVAAPSAPLEQEQTFPGANPKAHNVLRAMGPPDSRGHAAAYRNLKTGERFSVLTPAGREKVRNQLVSLHQAIPYIDDLIHYGTVGAIGPSGKNELIPNAWGGVPRGVGANYDKALAAASEHIMTGSQMQKTDKTTDMIHTILNRQNFESREDYTNRMRVLQKHLRGLDQNGQRSLGMNMMSVDKFADDAQQKYLEGTYNEIKNPDKVIMIDIKTGKKGYVPQEDVKEALASKRYRMAE